MSPLVFVDNRPRLPREAAATINLGATLNETWVIKPRDAVWERCLAGKVNVVTPQDLGATSYLESFRTQYVHMSTNPVSYERGCLERFILLHRLMESEGLDSAWHFDTDAWATTDLSILSATLADKDLVAFMPATPGKGLPSVSVSQSWMRISTVAAFTDFLLFDLYTPALSKVMHDWYAERLAEGLTGGISDMTAWGLFLTRHNTLRIVDSRSTLVGGSILLDTLYPSRAEQFSALGLSDDSRLVRLYTGRWPPELEVGQAKVPIAGVHFSGADKALVWTASRREPIVVDSLHHKMLRFKFRLLRRIHRLGGFRAS